MQGVVSGLRWALLDSGQAPSTALAVSTAVALFALATGAVVFRRLERSFADVV
jgi:ABC-type polysaccharide/polyol phosphate export permease